MVCDVVLTPGAGQQHCGASVSDQRLYSKIR